MNTSALISGLPTAILLIVLAFVSLVVYALHRKGDVRAELSHGATKFKLEAKERPAPKSRRRFSA